MLAFEPQLRNGDRIDPFLEVTNLLHAASKDMVQLGQAETEIDPGSQVLTAYVKVGKWRATYDWDAVLITVDKEIKDASDDDNHERRNGRHPE